jgi:transcriptional regulator of acetoin/glycerol metabolism
MDTAAKAQNISRSTLYRRLRNPEYASTYFYLDPNNNKITPSVISQERQAYQNQQILYLGDTKLRIFNNLTEASSFLKLNKTTISRKLKSSRQTGFFPIKTLERSKDFLIYQP